jgi:hypothetical protein
VDFFYGASQNGREKCGVGAMINCPEGYIFSIKMNFGMGKNTRGELLALWSLLYFPLHKQVYGLQLVGDSKVFFYWFSYKNKLQVISLQPWCNILLLRTPYWTYYLRTLAFK